MVHSKPMMTMLRTAVTGDMRIQLQYVSKREMGGQEVAVKTVD